MKSVIKLIRLPNLLIIALTMYLTRYCIIQKQLQLKIMDLAMEDVDFLLLTLSVVMIAAAGYIINDYFDTRIDSVNKPDKVVIDKEISRGSAIKWHIGLSTLGVLIGFYLALKIGVYKLGFINLVSVGLLWFYSTTYKRKFLIGNVVVAVLSGLIPIVVGFYEPQRAEINFYFVLGYGIFAFIISLVREIVKDIEDVEGDRHFDCRTMPVVIGVNATKIIATFIGLILAAMIGFLQYSQYLSQDKISFWYFTLLIQLPLLILLYTIITAKQKADFHKASTISKIVMITGVFSMYIFYLSLS